MTIERGNHPDATVSGTQEDEMKQQNKETYRHCGSGISSLQETIDEFKTDVLTDEEKETVGLLKSHLFVAGRLMRDLSNLGRR